MQNFLIIATLQSKITIEGRTVIRLTSTGVMSLVENVN